MLQELGAVYELSEGEYIGYKSRCQSQQNILDFGYGGDKGPPQIMCVQPEYKLHCSVGETCQYPYKSTFARKGLC